ncbi:MAG: DNA mismatch endonuclease Vsr [Chromatiales bacterium]|nr:DNA mismatch endonuclease Vsr [Chromatiales bacterium]
MTDIVDRTTRSRMMAGIRGKDTRPELVIRKGLHKAGFRYRLHDKSLPGRPDLVLPRYKALIFINGCFWHGHKCAIFKWPSTRTAFWRDKIRGNAERDSRNRRLCTSAGWRVLTIWECSLKGPGRLGPASAVIATSTWLRSRRPIGEILGRNK